MGDPSVPDEQEDIERLLNEDNNGGHGPGDLQAIPPSDFDDPNNPDGIDV